MPCYASATLMKTALFLFGSVAATALVFTACSSATRNAAFDDPDGAVRIDGGLGFGEKEAAPQCTNLECKQVTCSGGGTTTLTGTVYSPMGASGDPIYNAILYVPNADLEPFPKGASCDKCGTITSGSPLVTALSDSEGKFTLENVPAGDDIPLVIQVGRWRRMVTIDHVDACKSNSVPAEKSRLPRNQQEGDIPLMAIVTSPYDATECILKKMGVDTSEFTVPSGTGRIHIYKGGGATLATTPPSGDQLWNNPATLTNYDVIALPCSSQPTDMTGRQNVVDYADNGGRVFITDLSQDVIKQGPAPWPSTANWTPTGSFANPASIDMTFPKGQAMAEWLKNIGATPTMGQIDLTGTYNRTSGTMGDSQRWVYSSETLQTYSFNTPVGADEATQCGRVFYSSFHVSQGGYGTFPASCNSTAMTAQEKALEFMLFDLAACIIKDGEKPQPPPVK